MQTVKPNWSNFAQPRLQNLSSTQKNILLAGVLLIGASFLMPDNNHVIPVAQRIPLTLDLDTILPQVSEPIETAAIVDNTPDFERIIVSGDTLSGLFSKAGVDQQTMYKVLEADLNILALDTLLPGNRMQFWLDNEGQLEKLELYFNSARQVVFTRYDDGSFNVEEVNVEGVWQNRILSGEIKGSFYVSAQKIGLSAADISRVEELLKEKVNFARDLHAGDQFSVLVNDQFVEGEATGGSQILGVSIKTGRSEISAFQNTDGSYYDAKGRSLVRAFQRIPLAKQPRMSSRFNSHRKHPITGRLSPHNGADFAVPIGTKVLAPGDGVVTLVTDHQFAGKYIVVDHGGKYRTRYLHLSKALVRKGQRVTRGQVIALSGNTGRSTGPHLHYEFHINGKPVDPMKADIPMSSQLAGQDLRNFTNLVKSRQAMMDLG